MPDWRFMLCDKQGRAIENISPIARDVQFSSVLNTPSSLSFTVPSDDPRVADPHTDGSPKLHVIKRTVKAYRWEEQSDGSMLYVPRFVGYVWPVSDDGDPNDGTTVVTCFEPLHVLAFRLSRHTNGAVVGVRITLPGSSTLKALIERTNQAGGPTGLTTAGSSWPALGFVNGVYDKKMISEWFDELTGSFDIVTTPLDREDWTHSTIGVAAKRGIHRPEMQLGWRAWPENVAGVSRITDPESSANWLYVTGASDDTTGVEKTVVVADAVNVGDYMQLEAVSSYADILNATQLQKAALGELAQRTPPSEAYTLSNDVLEHLEAWTDFDLGDTFPLEIGTELRGGEPRDDFRILGFTLDLSNEGDEKLGMTVSRDG